MACLKICAVLAIDAAIVGALVYLYGAQAVQEDWAQLLIYGVLLEALWFCFGPACFKKYAVEGKSAVVTGASAGIGVAIAHSLAQEGCSHIALFARRQQELQKVCDELAQTYPNTKFLAVQGDVSKSEDRVRLLDTCTKEFGATPQILVNNAGVEKWLATHLKTEEEINQELGINCNALIQMSVLFLKAMTNAGTGHIVNIGSVGGKFAIPYGTIYAASKGAVVLFTRSLRTELKVAGSGVSAHCIAPGFVKDAGMAKDAEDETGLATPLVYGFSYPSQTGKAVVDAIKYDISEKIVNMPPNRWLGVIGECIPGFYDFFNGMLPECVSGIWFFKNIAKGREAEGSKMTEQGNKAPLV